MDLQILKKIYCFEETSEADLRRLQTMLKPLVIPQGKSIFDKGEKSTALYWIENGSVKMSLSVRRSETSLLLGVGAVFGELAYLDRQLRWARATAVEPSKILVLDYDDLDKVGQESKSFLQGVSRRMALFLKEKIKQLPEDISSIHDLKLRCQ
jgi:CRP-like cAMP-binding protein